MKLGFDQKIEFSGKCRKTIELSNMGEQASKFHMKGKKHIANSKPVTCFFFQPKSVPVVQPVVTGIDDGPSGSSMKPLTVSTSQKQLTFDIDVVINLFCGKTKSRNSMGIEVCRLTGQPIQQNTPRSSHRRCYVKKVFLEASQNSQ